MERGRDRERGRNREGGEIDKEIGRNREGVRDRERKMEKEKEGDI